MNSGGGHVFEEAVNVFTVHVRSAVRVCRATVSTDVTLIFLRW